MIVNQPGSLNSDQLRNWLAYSCFGSQQLDFAKKPFSFSATATLNVTGLTNCDVPLALVRVDPMGKLDFVDSWAVRRQITPPSAAGRWGTLVGASQPVTSQAMFLQFQDHFDRIGKTSSQTFLSTLQSGNMSWLPPIGIVANAQFGTITPLPALLVQLPGPNDAILEPARLNSLFQEALTYPPIHVGTDPITIFRVQPTSSDPYWVFCTGYIERLSRFNLARFNGSNLL
jgi:hypothetical protein